MNETNTSYNDYQTRLEQSEKQLVYFYVEKRQLSSFVDGLQIEKTIFRDQLRDLQYNQDRLLAKENKAFEALKGLRASLEEVRRHADLLRNNDTTYNNGFKTDLHEGSDACLTQSQNSNKKLVKKRDLVISKSIHGNFAEIDEMLQSLETELSHLGQDLNPVDINELLYFCQVLCLLAALSCSGVYFSGLTQISHIRYRASSRIFLIHSFKMTWYLLGWLKCTVFGLIYIPSNSLLGYS